MSDWISVEVDMPKNGEVVDVWLDDDEIGDRWTDCSYRKLTEKEAWPLDLGENPDESLSKDQWICEAFGIPVPGYVSHWMLKPKPPEGLELGVLQT